MIKECIWSRSQTSSLTRVSCVHFSLFWIFFSFSFYLGFIFLKKIFYFFFSKRLVRSRLVIAPADSQWVKAGYVHDDKPKLSFQWLFARTGHKPGLGTKNNNKWRLIW